jgi:hypothetical protein
VAPCCGGAPVDLPAFRAQMAATAGTVRTIFARQLGDPTVMGEQSA